MFSSVACLLAIYGMANIITQQEGPFGVFQKLRKKAEGTPFEELLRCMICMPTNIGWVFSLVDWFFIPGCLMPFNILLDGTGLWWIAFIMDGCLAGGVCQFAWNIFDYIDKSTPIDEYTDNQ